MAVAGVATDTWIQHLPFVGGPRPSAFGPVDGIWYGVISVAGDSGGGNVTLNGRLSFDRKEDWVYILGGISTVTNDVLGQDTFTQVNTGPLIPTATAVTNPTFSRGGSSDGIAGNAVSVSDLNSGGSDPRAGMPIFGDKKIPGVFLMLAAGWQTNTDTVLYTMSSWGFLIRYESFFRLRSPSFG